MRRPLSQTACIVGFGCVMAFAATRCGEPNASAKGLGGAESAAVSSTQQPAIAASSDTDASSYYIMTRPDPRLCPSPMCGGYFVAQVNLKITPCADGRLARDCHASRLDFTPFGLSEAEAMRFESESFAKRFGVVRGKLVQREMTPGLRVDVLVVTEAWDGQARTSPRGWFNRLSSTGVVCVTYPCPSYKGERLNTNLVTSYNAVDLQASGAPPEAVREGYEALNDKRLLAVGVDVPITGPAGAGVDFRAVEFYQRVGICLPQDATGVGPCDRFFGYAWNGNACVGVSGCSCEGADCGRLCASLDVCEKEHADCRP
jgi:hypothetical protein